MTGIENVSFVVDERRGEMDTSPFEKISVSEYVREHHRSLPPDWGWRCGDFCYLAARAAYPEIERFWLIESDVWLPRSHIGELFRALSLMPHDALAAGLGPYPKPPRYSRMMERFVGSDRWGCIFPFTGASAGLIDAMENLRLRTLRSIVDFESPQLFPNDEAIFSGAVLESGLSHGDLYRLLPAFFSKTWFATNPPFLLEALDRDRPVAVVHPSVSLPSILAEIASGNRKNYDRHRLRRVLASASKAEKSMIRRSLNGVGAGSGPSSGA